MGGPSGDPPVESQRDGISEVDTAAPVASVLPWAPAKGSQISSSVEEASAARSRRDLSPRRVVLTKPNHVVPTLKIIQSSPIDAFSPVASSTPSKPAEGKVGEESPLLGKRRRDETVTGPIKSSKPRSKGKDKPVDPAPVHTSPIESPRFGASTPTRTKNRSRESGGYSGPEPKSKALRPRAVPTSPINSAVFPPNTELPYILSRHDSFTVSSNQSSKRPRDDKPIKIKSKLPPPAEASVADASVIESFDTSPPKPPTTTKKAGPVDNNKKPQVPLETAAAGISFLTSPGTSPEKRSTLLPSLPPLHKTAQRPKIKNPAGYSTIANLTSPENPKEESVSNTKDIIVPNPLLGKSTKTMGITKLRPAATTIAHAEAGPSKASSGTMPLRSRSTLGQVQTRKNPIIPTKKGKDKPVKMTPVEYAEMLIERYSNPNRKIPNVSQHLRGRIIFYVGVDRQYAGDGTKKKMEYVRIFTIQDLASAAHPILDPQAWRHIGPQI